MNKWDFASIEEYLGYSLNLLDLLNSITYTLSHLGQAQLSLSHALSLVENSPSSVVEHLRGFQSKNLCENFKLGDIEESKERLCSGKEWIIHQALLVIKSIGLWVCGVVLSSLCSDVKPYMEIKKSAFLDSSLKGLDSDVCKEITEKRGIAKELKEVNDAAACLLANIASGKNHDAGKELRRRLEVLTKVLQGVGKEADSLFSEVLAARNKSLDTVREKKQ